MVNDPRKAQVVAILWFVAAGLAFIGVAITLAGNRKPNLGVLAGGVFCLAMGIASLSRKAR